MRIEILDEAREDLIQGFHIYESQEPGLGSYFIEGLFSDVDSILVYAGQGFIRSCTHITDASPSASPSAIYYSVEKQLVRVHAVLDCRRNPSWIRKRLKAGS